MTEAFIRKLKLDNFLSFAPGSDAIELKPLNVLIGPNGSGKSNLIEALGLLRALPTDFAQAIRGGGGAGEWLWKGESSTPRASIQAEVFLKPLKRHIRYRLDFAEVQQRVEVLDEAIEELEPHGANKDVYFYYRYQNGHPVINSRQGNASTAAVSTKPRSLRRDSLLPDQSVLSQRKDPDLYPEITETGTQFNAVQIFREWNFGRSSPLRLAQQVDQPTDQLLPDMSNLALILNEIEHRDSRRLNDYVKRFFPRYERLSTRILGGTVQLYLHEIGFGTPIPATRLSDGTIHFLAVLAALMTPNPPPLICIDEPELGLHPDAMRLLAEVLIEAQAHTQIIVTTHSDILVSELTEQGESVVVCERPGPGTVLQRVDPDKIRFWLDKYRLGEIWRIGELGGNL